MNYNQLFQEIIKKRSFLCVGLDTELDRIPSFLLEYDDPVYEFNKRIIDATANYAIAYKPNLAFYEAVGTRGWMSLEKTIQYIKRRYPDIFLIADAKRGDIGNTSRMYARAFFKVHNFDAVTVAPYMGRDSVEPFLNFEDKWVVLLVITSNESASDFQLLKTEDNSELYRKVLLTSIPWGNKNNMMFVVGATQAPLLKVIRDVAPEHFLLIPGIGSQGGNLEEVMEYGMNDNCGLIVNSARSIIYADDSEYFASAAKDQAAGLQEQMSAFLNKRGLI